MYVYNIYIYIVQNGVVPLRNNQLRCQVGSPTIREKKRGREGERKRGKELERERGREEGRERQSEGEQERGRGRQEILREDAARTVANYTKISRGKQ